MRHWTEEKGWHGLPIHKKGIDISDPRPLNQVENPYTSLLGINDRVSRQEYMDDGTWDKEGDKCLDSSSIKHGTVTAIELEPKYLHRSEGEPKVLVKYRQRLYVVEWDNSAKQRYFRHGLKLEEIREVEK